MSVRRRADPCARGAAVAIDAVINSADLVARAVRIGMTRTNRLVSAGATVGDGRLLVEVEMTGVRVEDSVATANGLRGAWTSRRDVRANARSRAGSRLVTELIRRAIALRLTRPALLRRVCRGIELAGRVHDVAREGAAAAGNGTHRSQRKRERSRKEDAPQSQLPNELWVPAVHQNSPGTVAPAMSPSGLPAATETVLLNWLASQPSREPTCGNVKWKVPSG